RVSRSLKTSSRGPTLNGSAAEATKNTDSPVVGKQPGCREMGCRFSVAALHRDFFTIGRGRLRQRDVQDSLLEDGLGLFLVNIGRQRHRAMERAVRPLDAMVVLVLFLLFDLLLSAKRQDSVRERDFDVLFLDAGKFSLDVDFGFGLADIDPW